MREGWDTNPLGDLLIDASPGFACGDDLDTGIFQIRMNNLSSAGRLVLDKRRRVPANHKKVASTTLNPGDVLFNATNSPDLVGKSAFFGGCDEPAVYSNHFLRLRTQTDKLDPRYLSMWLQREFGRGYFKSQCKQWVNQATFGKDLLVKLPISLPPLEEQRRIASILDAADELRTKRQQAIDQLDTLTQAIFHDMFGDLALNPMGWDAVPVRELADGSDGIRCGPFGTQLAQSEYRDEGVPLWGIPQVNRSFSVDTTEFLTPEKAAKLESYSLLPGDIVMTRKGTVGNCAVYPSDKPLGIMHSDLLRLRLAAHAEPVFVSAQLSHSRAVGEQIRAMSGGAVMPGINVTKLKELVVHQPPIEMQRDFSRRSAAIELHLCLVKTNEAALDSMFTSLQQRAFRGDL